MKNTKIVVPYILLLATHVDDLHHFVFRFFYYVFLFTTTMIPRKTNSTNLHEWCFGWQGNYWRQYKGAS